ncbi:MAG: hypothetical protein MI749_09520, partial [Desulfovibrionales bacterium]|nr:hypothetical protein [Desulfovibrionales bacterium]
MKKAFFIVCIILIAAFSVKAQNMSKEDLPPAEERAEMLTGIMKEKLSLTEDQVDDVYQINLTTARETDALMELDSKMDKYKAYRASSQKKDESLKK